MTPTEHELPPGTKIRFTRRIDQPPDEDGPGCCFARPGELGEVIEFAPAEYESAKKWPYRVRRDGFEFRASREEFEAIT